MAPRYKQLAVINYITTINPNVNASIHYLYLGWALGIFLHSLHGHDIRFQGARHANYPIHRLRNLQRVRDRQADETRSQTRLSFDDGKERGKKNDAIPDEFQAHGEPTIAAHIRIIGRLIAIDARVALVDERLGRAVGANRARAGERLLKVRVNGRTRDGLDSLQLSRRSDVEALREEIEDAERHHNGEKDGRRIADDEDDADGDEERVQKSAERLGNDLVDHVDVLGETIDDASERRRVEKRHGRAEDVDEEIAVEFHCR